MKFELSAEQTPKYRFSIKNFKNKSCTIWALLVKSAIPTKGLSKIVSS